MKEQSRILQIIPAVGFYAVYFTEENGAAKSYSMPVACWALMLHYVVDHEGEEIEESRSVVGMTGPDAIEDAEELTNFVGYYGPGETEEDLKSNVDDMFRDFERARSAGRKG